jgi:hypothetical protein
VEGPRLVVTLGLLYPQDDSECEPRPTVTWDKVRQSRSGNDDWTSDGVARDSDCRSTVDDTTVAGSLFCLPNQLATYEYGTTSSSNLLLER